MSGCHRRLTGRVLTLGGGRGRPDAAGPRRLARGERRRRRVGTRAAARGVAVRHSCAAAGRHENEVCQTIDVNLVEAKRGAQALSGEVTKSYYLQRAELAGGETPEIVAAWVSDGTQPAANTDPPRLAGRPPYRMTGSAARHHAHRRRSGADLPRLETLGRLDVAQSMHAGCRQGLSCACPGQRVFRGIVLQSAPSAAVRRIALQSPS